MRSVTTPPLSLPTVAKLFGVGATVGPLVDSLHNQCLLQYHYAPIDIPSPFPAAQAADPSSSSLLIATSWLVPPLLGFAYVVLGSVLPRLLQWGLDALAQKDLPILGTQSLKEQINQQEQTLFGLQTRAIVAVLTTPAIIKLSEYLELHPTATESIFAQTPMSSNLANQHIVVLLGLALFQWAMLDGTLAALLAASITSIGGPLSELPFVAADIWQYLPSAGDYVPLQDAPSSLSSLLTSLLGPGYNQLTLSSITGPCYFAVTMDAIALGRWFDGQQEQNEQQQQQQEITSTEEAPNRAKPRELLKL